MKISGRQLLPVESNVVRSILNDPASLKQIIPGCENLEAAGPDEFRVVINLRIGTISDRFIGFLRLREAGHSPDIDMWADGESPNGLVNLRGHITLEDEPGNSAAVCYEVDIDVGGRLASLSPRMLETTARAFARRCLENLERQTMTRSRIYTTSITPPPRSHPPGASPAHIDRARRMIAWTAIPLGIVFLVRLLERWRTKNTARQVVDMLEHANLTEDLAN